MTTLIWADDPGDVCDSPHDGIVWEGEEAHDGFTVTYVDGIAPWMTRGMLPWSMRDDIVTGSPGRRARDRVASRWAPDSIPGVNARIEELRSSVIDRNRRRRNRLSMAARGWAHVV